MPTVDDTSLSLTDIICIGLGNLDETHFTQTDANGNVVLRYEDAISWYFGNEIAKKIRGIYISPQHIPNVVSGTKSPAIDYFINGKHNLYLELVRNSDRLEAHFQKFGNNGVYKSNRAWAIVDILSERTSPVLNSDRELPLSRKDENHLYSFTKSNNTLWKGRTEIKKNVSVNLRAHAFSTLTHSTFINSQVVRQFCQIGKWLHLLCCLESSYYLISEKSLKRVPLESNETRAYIGMKCVKYSAQIIQ